MLVTDYSNKMYDFVYQEKPVICAHFDEDNLHYEDRLCNDYDGSAFGPVTKTVEETVDAIIHYLENGCKMEEIYVRRAKEFFCYTDDNNCKRVYDHIVNMEKNVQFVP